MKKFVKITAIILVMIVTMAVFASCKPNTTLIDQIIGKKKPTVSGTTAVSASMSATEMLDAAVKNFNDAEYVGKYNYGKVVTKIMSAPFVQVVDSVYSREGKSSDTNAIYHLDNKSASGFVRVWEETYIKGDTVKFRNSKKEDIKFNKKDNTFTVKKFNETKDYSGNYEKYKTDFVNDPKNIWAYNINKDTITEASEVKKSGDTFTFSIKCNYDIKSENNAIKDYYKLMEYMLNQSVTFEGLEFRGLEFSFTVWENGLLKNFSIKEKYFMKVSGVINSEVELNSFSQLTYDKAEMADRIANIAQLSK